MGSAAPPLPTWANPGELVGTELDGRYRLLRVLGSGGMGAVFEAEQSLLRKRVAVKVLHPRLAQNPDHVERFLREAQAASKVRNMHVVDISDFGHVPGGSVYYVMELLDGRDLHHVVRELGRMPWPRAKSVLLQIAHALEAAHREGVVHRDVKPANCVILRDPDDPQRDFVKMVDFGIAKIFEGGSRRGLTRPDEIMGTVAYMAPEQALCRPVDERTDVYALGVVAFELLAGRVPFVSSDAFEVLDQHCKAPPPSLPALCSDITPALDAVIQRALQKDPRARYPNMRAFEQALRSLGDDGHRLVGDESGMGEAPTLAPGVQRVAPGAAAGATTPQSLVETDPAGSPSNPPQPAPLTPVSMPSVRRPSPGLPTAVIFFVWVLVLGGGVVLGAWLVFRLAG